MNIRATLLVSIIACAPLGACSSAEGENAGVTEWLGDETHLAISGAFQGSTFDVHLEGAEADSVYCNRFYTPLPGATPDAEGNYDGTQVYFAMKELGGIINFEGEPKEFTIAYWRHDVAEGTELDVIPRQFGESIPEGKTWSDINMFNPGENLLSGVESAASSGTVKLLLNSGSPDASGVMRPSGGRTGEFVSVSWGPRESLNISATADCVSMVVPWAQDLVAP